MVAEKGGDNTVMMEIEKLKDMLRNAAGSPVGIQMCQEAADALEHLQVENEKLKNMVACYCDMCLDEDGRRWCQVDDCECDYCIRER